MRDENLYSSNELSIPLDELLQDDLIEDFPNYEGAGGEYVETILADLMKEVPWRIKPRGGYRIIEPAQVRFSKKVLLCGETELRIREIIYSRLKKAQSVCIFALTIGDGLETWARELISRGDYLEGYLVDWLASSYTEKAADWIERDIEKTAGSYALNITARYSPGYCGWDLADQKKLFSLLPAGFCGIELTDSSLMLPLKSISGILGIGENVAREDYNCSICKIIGCIKKK